jgi:transcriptional regulator with XRE-family HTH domain
VRENIRLLKSWKRLSDTDLARAGGFTSRQVVCNRLAGRTPIDIDDLARLAIALKVDPSALWMEADEMIAWLQRNGDYKPPRAKRRTGRKASAS